MNFAKKLICAGMVSSAFSATAQAAEWSVQITNLSHGIYFTPLLVTAHGSAARLFEAGTAASTELQAMAEGGDTSGLLTGLGGADGDTVDNPAGGLLAPGGSTTATLMPAANHGSLSLVAMILPSNDAFVGIDSVAIPTTPGSYTFYANAYDAGTEANNEMALATGGMPGVLGMPAAGLPGMGSGGTGVTTNESNNTVHIHRNTLGDTDANGGHSDADSRIHRWLNPVARVVVTVK